MSTAGPTASRTAGPSTTSPPTARVLDVLELLAGRAAEPPRLRDLVRELGLTHATAHAIMATLCDRGWAVRDATTRTFTLGPALGVAAARSAARRSRRQTAAAAVVRAFASEFGYPAGVTERLGDELVITTFDLGVCQIADVAAGDRLPFAAPFGAAFAAWEDGEGRRAWLQRGAVTSPGLADRLDAMLTATRERGFGLERSGPATSQAARLMAALRGDPRAAAMRRTVDGLLTEITARGFETDGEGDDERRAVTSIAAPVFDAHSGQVALTVSIHPIRPMSAERADALGRRLLAATAAIGAAERTAPVPSQPA
ncbi:helix-turn-helix domain-containing protein [Frankia sp. AgKG'84/4]|uniref:helix-turn-helix domain-containing protein n=1 Tax=Frankia sp. AgKG'84/4 TaxID=573490 RepID=UPI00202A8736|nr:helix-turn-helix domain-containing protein [Frankia sp. AgKG'84/4]MCL9796559.1 helix-turn-helix domain-containing protein [Frankia sp. AgKG'84/4]